LWGKASSGVVDMARLRTERIKKDLETEAAKQNCAIAYFEEDGDTIYTVKDKDGKDLGYVAIDDIGNIFYRSSKDGSVELKVNGGTGAIRGLITAQSFDRATAKSGVMFSKAAEYQHVKDYCNQNKVAVRA
jgi:imidazole glycerol phosphate synthase subunit HisF